MIRILLVAAVVSLALAFVKQDFIETLGIIFAIILATTVGFFFERDAARKFDVLTQLGEEQPVKVLREGKIIEIPRREVVVGDVVIVETGDEVPADGHLFESTDLQVDESSLTGEPITTKESLPYVRHLSQKRGADEGLSEGFAAALIDGDGRHRPLCGDSCWRRDEIGHVARQATELTGVKTPLNIQLDRLAKLH